MVKQPVRGCSVPRALAPCWHKEIHSGEKKGYPGRSWTICEVGHGANGEGRREAEMGVVGTGAEKEKPKSAKQWVVHEAAYGPLRSFPSLESIWAPV